MKKKWRKMAIICLLAACMSTGCANQSMDTLNNDVDTTAAPLPTDGNLEATPTAVPPPALPEELPVGTPSASPRDVPLDPVANAFTDRDKKVATNDGFEPMGALYIPAIDCRETIVSGAQKEQIKRNVGRVIGSQDPGEKGQCVISGHRYYDWGNCFNRLDELALGDKVDIAMPDGTYYRYSVTEVILSEPKPYDLFRSDGTKYKLMLVTCHPIKVSTHQLLVVCELETVVEPDGSQHPPV